MKNNLNEHIDDLKIKFNDCMSMLTTISNEIITTVEKNPDLKNSTFQEKLFLRRKDFLGVAEMYIDETIGLDKAKPSPKQFNVQSVCLLLRDVKGTIQVKNENAY